MLHPFFELWEHKCQETFWSSQPFPWLLTFFQQLFLLNSGYERGWDSHVIFFPFLDFHFQG